MHSESKKENNMIERFRKILTAYIVIAILATFVLVPCASAQNKDTEFSLAIYGWLPTIKGTLAFDVPGLGDTIEVDPGTLIDNLKFTAQGALAVRYGKWSVLADVIYLKEAKSEDALLDIGSGINLSATFKLRSWITSFGGAYEVARSQGGTTLDLLAGARYFYVNQSLSLKADGPLMTDEMVEKSSSVWNGFVGVKGRLALSKHWFIPTHLDIGLGGSDFMWQGMAGISYDFRWGAIVLAYRYLEFNQGDDSLVRKLSFGGAKLGAIFRF